MSPKWLYYFPSLLHKQWKRELEYMRLSVVFSPTGSAAVSLHTITYYYSFNAVPKLFEIVN